MKHTQKKGLIFGLALLSALSATTIMAADKVVVIPMGGSQSALQHYRIAESIGVNTTFCTTPDFTMPSSALQAVLTSNVSVTDTADNAAWWTVIEYSNNNGVSWDYISSLRTVSGLVANRYANTSEISYLNLAPSSSYRFRIRTDGSSHTGGQCELFITFNESATSDLVSMPAATAAAATVISGPGTIPVQ